MNSKFNEEIKAMSDEALVEYKKSLQALRWNASQMRNASQFGRLDRQFTAVVNEIIRRRREGQ